MKTRKTVSGSVMAVTEAKAVGHEVQVTTMLAEVLDDDPDQPQLHEPRHDPVDAHVDKLPGEVAAWGAGR